MKVKRTMLVLICIAAIASAILVVINISGRENEAETEQLQDVQGEYAEHSDLENNTSQLQSDNINQNEGITQLGNAEVSQEQDDFEESNENGSRAYRYKENDGIFVFYETEDEDLYRKLLPEEFDMPDHMVVHLFVMDFYDIDSDAEPYKEMSISLLAEYNNEEVWHCIYMPVTSQQSMVAGKIGLGLPKTIGDIQFIRDDLTYTGIVTDEQNRTGTIAVDTNGYDMSLSQEDHIRNFMDIPKINLLNGKAIEMTTNNGAVNIMDVAKRYPNYVTVQGGKATISFDAADNAGLHPFDLEPTTIIAAYYLHNKIPFNLDRS